MSSQFLMLTRFGYFTFLTAGAIRFIIRIIVFAQPDWTSKVLIENDLVTACTHQSYPIETPHFFPFLDVLPHGRRGHPPEVVLRETRAPDRLHARLLHHRPSAADGAGGDPPKPQNPSIPSVRVNL